MVEVERQDYVYETIHMQCKERLNSLSEFIHYIENVNEENFDIVMDPNDTVKL